MFVMSILVSHSVNTKYVSRPTFVLLVALSRTVGCIKTSQWSFDGRRVRPVGDGVSVSRVLLRAITCRHDRDTVSREGLRYRISQNYTRQSSSSHKVSSQKPTVEQLGRSVLVDPMVSEFMI